MSTRVDTSDYVQLIQRLKGVDRKVANRIRRRLRRVAGPLGPQIVGGGAQRMPHRGGLAALIATKGQATTSLLSSGAAVNLRNRGVDLRSLERGRLRHLTWGRLPWRNQDVPAEAFSAALQALAPNVRIAMEREVRQILAELGG